MDNMQTYPSKRNSTRIYFQFFDIKNNYFPSLPGYHFSLFFKLQEGFDHPIYEGNSVRKLLKKGASTNIQYHNLYENKIRTIIEQNKLTSLWWLFLCIMRVSLGPFHSVSGHLHCLHPRQTHKPKSHLYCNFFFIRFTFHS